MVVGTVPLSNSMTKAHAGRAFSTLMPPFIQGSDSSMKFLLRSSIHYWIRLLCRVPAALGKGTFAVGKGFAECGSRQSPLGKEVVGKGIFAECHVAGTRQRICRVPHQHSAKVTGAVNLTAPFAECRRVRHSAKEIFFEKFFTEC